MRKVPEYIKRAIKMSAKYNAIASLNNEKVREWLTKNNLDNNANIDQLIDSIEIGNNPESFIEYLKNDAIDGNDEED